MNVPLHVLREIKSEMTALAAITRQRDWTPGEETRSEPIPVSKWETALAVAKLIAIENPHLDKPTPGADPGGFVWLTWTAGTRGLALEIREGVPCPFRWTQSVDGDKRTYESDSLNDLNEAIRTVFPRPLVML